MQTIRTGPTLRRSGVALLAAAALTFTALTPAAQAIPEGTRTSTGGDVVGWGLTANGRTNAPEPPAGTSYRAISGGAADSLALRSDGQVVGFGASSPVAPPLGGSQKYVAVSAGLSPNFLYLRSDGQILGSGDNSYGQRSFPAPPAGVRYVAIAAGYYWSLGLRSDGRIVAVGYSGFGTTTVPALPAGLTYKRIATGYGHALAVRSDGRVIAWGSDSAGETVPPALPSGVKYTGISAGYLTSLAVRSDGKAVGFGYNNDGQATPPNPPSGSKFVEVASTYFSSAALTNKGKIVTWGSSTYGALDVPAAPAGTRYSTVVGGGYHFLALTVRTTKVVATPPSGWRYGKTAKLAAKVTAVGVTPTGIVSVYKGATFLGKAALVSGKANVTLKAKVLKPGVYALTVKYSGANALAPSSTKVNVRVYKAIATAKAALVSSTIPKTANAKVKVYVTAPNVIPTGKVRVYDGAKALVTRVLYTSHHGKITVMLPRLKPGLHAIRVVYLGSPLVTKDWAPTVVLKVKP
jgi:hypothetical protein